MSVPLASMLRLLAFVCILTVGAAVPAGAQLLDVDPFIALDATADEHFANFSLGVGSDSSTTVLTGRWTREISRQAAMVQRFSPAGTRIGGLVRVDAGADVGSTGIAPGLDGGFIAFWRDQDSNALMARLLDATAAPTTPVFTVTNATAFQRDGVGFGAGIAIVWSGPDAVSLRLYDAAGNPLGPSAIVASVPAYAVVRLGIAPTSSAGFVVVWDEPGRVRARVYGAAGVPLGEPVELTDEFRLGEVAGNPLGGFAIVGGRMTDTHALPSGVWIRRFDATGAPSGPADIVDFLDTTTSFVILTAAAFDPVGRLYVTWDTSSFLVSPRGRAYDPRGRPLQAPFALTTDEEVSMLGLVARPDGRFVEGWRKLSDLGLQVRSLCVPPAHVGCGDGTVAAPCERCDAGPANSDTTPDACRTTCALPACADGVVDHGETCDDGNRRGCDGCDAACNVEIGWVCGDGAVSGDCSEECDDGAGNDDGVPNACRTDCRRAHCGDGVLDDGEACDDGNRTSCDGCSDLCVLEPGLTCGDGIAELSCGEQCDDGNAIVGDGCTEPCRLERVPGGGSPASDCHVEWVVDNPANVPLYDKKGAINGVQTCRDGDPRCDFEGLVGTCTFHVRVCANNTDLETCSPGSRLRSWELRAPAATKAATRPALAAVRDAFATVPGAIVGPPTTDVCSGTLAVPVGVKTSAAGAKPGSIILKSYATLYTGEKDADKLKLICLP